MKPLSAATAACLPLSLCLLAAAPALADPPRSSTTDVLTVATFNASLNRDAPGQLLDDLATADNAQASNVAETIQRVDPDIILINEFDYDATAAAVDLFRTNYLEVPHNGAQPVTYPYSWAGSVNTGVPSGFDLDGDGSTSGPSDAWGFGKFPGQYGFVVYSKYPIKTDQIRTFQNFLWKDMPGALLPTNADGSGWYSDEILQHFPLSSKTHADLPVDVDGTTVHVLAAHPTPPSFDGPEQRNKKRNFDEIRVWSDYVANRADYLYDDKGVKGGLSTDANFVILGDYNSDPLDGDSYPPNTGTQVDEAQVFWPTRDDELFRLTGLHPFPTSDHRMVWTKLRFPAAEPPAPEQPNPGDQGQAGPSGAGKSGKLANSGTHVGLLGMIALTAGLGGALLIAQRRARRRRA